MRARLVAGVFVGSFAILALAFDVSAASKTPVLHARTLTVHLANNAGGTPKEGPIEGLTLDGTKAAFVKGVPFTSACGLGRRVYRWNLASGHTSLVSRGKTCAQPDTSTGAGIFEIALTRSDSAWLLNFGGNTESGEMLFSPTAQPGKDKVLATSDRYQSDDGSEFYGTWIGGLVSDGSRLTYATWSTDASENVTASALWRISGSTATKIAHGSGAVVAASADGDRIALLRSDGSAATYGDDGSLLNTIDGAAPACTPEEPGPARCPGEAIALTGKLVALLADPEPWRQAGSIQVYDRTSGALLHTWPNITGYSWEFDAYDGIAIYGKGSHLHALDLQTGENTVVAKRSYTIEEARLDKAGLLYYINGSWSAKNGQNGQLVFVPFKTIAAKLGR